MADRGERRFDGIRAANVAQLCSCILQVDLQVPVQIDETSVPAILRADIELGSSASHDGIDREVLRLELRYGDVDVASQGRSGWFEDELLDIGQALPSGHRLKTCFTCQFADYSPYGHGLFGSMMCFRNVKDEYLKVQSKKDFWSVHDRPDRFVQETFLCDEFEPRTPGTGYCG